MGAHLAARISAGLGSLVHRKLVADANMDFAHVAPLDEVARKI
jgi:hypothetical protein